MLRVKPQYERDRESSDVANHVDHVVQPSRVGAVPPTNTLNTRPHSVRHVDAPFPLLTLLPRLSLVYIALFAARFTPRKV